MMAPTWTYILFLILLITFGIPLSFIDIREHRLPNLLTGALLFLSLCLVAAGAITFQNHHRLVESFLGALSLPAFYLLVSLITRGGVGMGDVKLSISVGLISGYFGWSVLWMSTFLAVAMGAVFSISSMIIGKVSAKDAIPFGPFILLGQFLALIALYRK
jgi:leader peptidase (prepilin peptidase)/N-methyltransferase